MVRVKVPGDLVDTGDCVSLRSPSPFLVHLIYLFLKEKLPDLLLQGMQPFSGHSNGPLLIFPIVSSRPGTCCSSRGPRLGSQSSHGSSQPSVIIVPEDALFWPRWALHAYSAYTNAGRTPTLIKLSQSKIKDDLMLSR